MEQNTKAPVKKAGNKNTELILGSAASKLSAGIKSLNSAVEVINKFEGIIDEKQLIVVNLEDKIGSLEQDFKNKSAQTRLELEQLFKADEKEFAETWLEKMDLISVSEEEHEKVKNDLLEAKHDLDKKISTAVNAATGSMKKDHENEIKMTNLQHQTKEAENTAKINQQNEQIKFLQEQVTMWKTALDSERAAGVQRAQAGSIGSINVGDTRK